MSTAQFYGGGKHLVASNQFLAGHGLHGPGLDGPGPDGLGSLEGKDERVLRLEAQVAHLELALCTQRQIGMTIGLMAQRFGCTTDQAWKVLVRVSQNTNIKVREVARLLCDAFNGEAHEEDAHLRRELAAHLPASGWPGVPSAERAEGAGEGSSQVDGET
jgi:hypothetical protein